jgi:tetratricopeptide (TPR) repeat protein
MIFSIEPENADNSFEFAQFLASLGNYQEALEYFSRAELLLPMKSKCKYYVAETMFQLDVDGK